MWQSSWPAEYNPHSENHRHADVLRIFERCVKPRVPLDWTASLKCYHLTADKLRDFVLAIHEEYHVRVSLDMVHECGTLHELVDLVVTLSKSRRRGSAPSLVPRRSTTSQPDESDKFVLLITQENREDIISLGRLLMSDSAYRSVFERTSKAVSFDLIDLSERRHHSVVQTCLHQYSLATFVVERHASKVSVMFSFMPTVKISHICSDRSSWFIACAVSGIMSVTLAIRLTLCQLASLSRDVVMVSTVVDAHQLTRSRWAVNVWDGQEYVTRVSKHHCVSFVCDTLPFDYKQALTAQQKVIGIGSKKTDKIVNITSAKNTKEFNEMIQSI